MSFNCTFSGFEKLTESLSEKILRAELAKQIVKRNGAEMHEKAQRFAPVDTGTLKRSISLDIVDEGRTAIVRGDNVDYGVYQEYGTRYQSGTPFVGPAFKEQVGKFKEDMRGILKWYHLNKAFLCYAKIRL